MNDVIEVLLVILFVLFCVGVFISSVALYFAPTIIAKVRKKSNVGGIAIINATLGWLGAGWIVALVMACSSEQPSATTVVQVRS